MSRERKRDLVLLLVISLAVRLAMALSITRPGYMDPAYYAAGAVRIAQSGEMSEPYIWHYLDDPAGLPHPAFLYWMPLPSLLAAVPAALFPGSFFALQIPFALLSAALPLVAYGVAWEASARRRTAWVAGLLTLFSGFFFPYWTLPETFAPFALAGSGALWLAGRRWGQDRESGWWAFSWLAGLSIGLAHLTRADGILLLPVAMLAPLFVSSPPAKSPARSAIAHCLLVITGYLLVMLFWFGRNMAVIGAPLAPGGTRTLWLTCYDDIFCYGCDLSLRSYLDWGWREIVYSKLWASGLNLQRFLAEDCLVFMLPFALVGFYRLRRRTPFPLSVIFFLLIYLAHSLAFTFPGPRGGFFHASAAALPFLFAAAAEGLEAAVDWAARRRRWPRQQAQAVFAVAAVAAAIALSGWLALGKARGWRHVDTLYVEAGRWLAQQTTGEATVMVANPPAFWYHTGYPAVVVPNGDEAMMMAAVDRYRVDYVLLDQNCPLSLGSLCTGDASHPNLARVMEWGEEENRAVLYAVER
ncbi:MAG: hypothetical protein JW900_11435 [Anaerolineae bacterium]|nr:hypothetical protein [Anaerolineae bacterium]